MLFCFVFVFLDTYYIQIQFPILVGINSVSHVHVCHSFEIVKSSLIDRGFPLSSIAGESSLDGIMTPAKMTAHQCENFLLRIGAPGRKLPPIGHLIAL